MLEKEMVLGAAQEMEGLELYYNEFAKASEKYDTLNQRVNCGFYRNFFGRLVFGSIFLYFFGKISVFLINHMPELMQKIVVGPNDVVFSFFCRLLMIMVIAGMIVPELYLPALFARLIYTSKIKHLRNTMEDIVEFATEDIAETQYLKNIPEKYIFPQAIYALKEYFEDGRADSLKEAINLLEREEYFKEMELRQNQIMEKAENASKFSGIAMGFSAANLLLNI